MAYLDLASGGQDSLTAVTTAIPDGLGQSFHLDVHHFGHVVDLDVTLELVHAVIEDLEIFRGGADGTLVELLTDLVADGNRMTATTLDDEAVQAISSGTGPLSGRYQPMGLLRAFDDKVVSGTWIVYLMDDERNGQRDALLDWIFDVQLAPNPLGNLNQNGDLDATDYDILHANLGSSESICDIDGDVDADPTDVDY